MDFLNSAGKETLQRGPVCIKVLLPILLKKSGFQETIEKWYLRDLTFRDFGVNKNKRVI